MRRALDSSSRFVRRHWQRRLQTLRPALVTIAICGVIAFAGWALLFSSWLDTDHVEVNGATTISADEVIAAAQVPTGTPLVRLDLDDVNRRVSAIPVVDTVSVHRSWPDTLTITITERTPVATIHRGGAWWLMDHEGAMYRKADVRDPGLAIVEFHGEADRTALREVSAVINALPPAVRDETKRIEAASMDSIRLMLRGGQVVMWGSSAESDRKVQVLALLMKTPAAVYDVSVPAQPTTSKRPPG